MYKEIIKSAVWGILLLVLTLQTAMSVAFVYSRSTSFYTNSLVSEYQKTFDVTTNELDKLHDYMLNKSASTTEYWSAYGDEVVTKVVDDVRLKIEKNCPHCDLYFFTPKSSYDLNDFQNKLKRRASVEDTKQSNYINAFLLAMSLINLAFSVYLLVGLFKYKKLEASGVTILVMLVLPFYTISTSFMLMHIDDYMGLDDGGKLAYFIIVSIVYLFIIYPIIFSISKKRNFNFKNILKLSNNKD